MKKSIATFTLVILMIALLVSVALFGIRAWGIPGVFDDGGIRLGLDLAGGSSILYEAEGPAPSSNDLDAAVQMIRHRLDNLMGLTEATVTTSGNRQILVEIPGISDPEEAVRQLGAAAVLQFRDADGNVVMDGSDVRSAVALHDVIDETGIPQWYISLTLESASVSKFAEATRIAASRAGEWDDELQRGKNYIAIYLDDTPISVPNVHQEINSPSCIISGDYNRDRATYEAGIINAGHLPFTLREVQLNATGPSLGMRSLQTSLIAGAIGMVMIMIFMIAYYRLPGVISAIALVAYTAIIGIVLVISPTNLSLPGIAGIILSIGMAVDANVIIFERIKEELRSGKSIKKSIESGFKRALVAIIDSNLTTLIVALVLWNFGSGPIVGFAMTLFIGVLVSMFTAISVTRWLLNQIVGMNVRNSKLYGL
jgi:protein-export membrane protein SecD